VKTDENIIEMLPGELRKIAEVVGLEAAVRIAQTFRGSFLYVPGLDDMMRMARDAMIKRDYDTGISARELAKKHRITERQIRKIVSTPGKDNLPGRLIDLLLEEE
jgi:Mor family transcriptional regulator